VSKKRRSGRRQRMDVKRKRGNNVP